MTRRCRVRHAAASVRCRNRGDERQCRMRTSVSWSKPKKSIIALDACLRLHADSTAEGVETSTLFVSSGEHRTLPGLQIVCLPMHGARDLYFGELGLFRVQCWQNEWLGQKFEGQGFIFTVPSLADWKETHRGQDKS